MATEQSITQALTPAAIEAAKAAIMIGTDGKASVRSTRKIKATPRLAGPTLKQQVFDWKVPGKYHKL